MKITTHAETSEETGLPVVAWSVIYNDTHLAGGYCQTDAEARSDAQSWLDEHTPIFTRLAICSPELAWSGYSDMVGPNTAEVVACHWADRDGPFFYERLTDGCFYAIVLRDEIIREGTAEGEAQVREWLHRESEGL